MQQILIPITSNHAVACSRTKPRITLFRRRAIKGGEFWASYMHFQQIDQVPDAVMEALFREAPSHDLMKARKFIKRVRKILELDSADASSSLGDDSAEQVNTGS